MKKSTVSKILTGITLCSLGFSALPTGTVKAETLNASYNSKAHALIGTSGEIGSFTTQIYLSQNYTTSGSNRIYKKRTCQMFYTAVGNIQPNFVSIGKIAIVNSTLDTVKTFDKWTSEDALFSGSQTYITSVQNNTSVTYSKTNKYYFFANVVIGNSDSAVGPYYADSLKLKLGA